MTSVTLSFPCTIEKLRAWADRCEEVHAAYKMTLIPTPEIVEEVRRLNSLARDDWRMTETKLGLLIRMLAAYGCDMPLIHTVMELLMAGGQVILDIELDMQHKRLQPRTGLHGPAMWN